MTAFFFKEIPPFRMRGFRPVRDVFDNLRNVLHLVEIMNTCGHCKTGGYDAGFDIAVFSGRYNRALVRKTDGFFSMAIPFQIVDHGNTVSYNYDFIGEAVDGQFISIMKNALVTYRDGGASHEDIVISLAESFDLEVGDAILYFDAFVALLADDHGYFRFDDDPHNENAQFHPRYHFDFFFKNTSAVKIGSDDLVDIECFYALFDHTYPKRYLK